MATAWDGFSDFFEEDEPFSVVCAVRDRAPDAVTGRLPSVLDVAASLLGRLSGAVDGWRLQKLCYLVQAHHLALTGLRAFREPIEAWTHGPVVARLYQAHREQGRDITSILGNASVVDDDEVLSRVVDDIVADYGGWTGSQLRKLTHSQTPWLEARRGLQPFERSQNHISITSMRDYFTRLESLPDDDAEDDCPLLTDPPA